MTTMSAMPNCCGASIIYGFPYGDSGDTTLREVVQKVQGSDDSGKSRASGGNQMIVCTLNDEQCSSNPKLLEVLAGLGFVFAGRTNNGMHNSWVNLFVRCEMKDRKYVEPPFSYPGTIALTQFEHPKTMARVPTKPGALPNPFKKDGGIEFSYVAVEEKVKVRA